MPTENPPNDRRRILARWMTSSDNPWFARNLANRLWAHFTGRGLVEPIDDFRATNPPSNPALLHALAAALVESGFDMKAMIRTITASRVYQLSSRPNETNKHDEQNYSRALLKRIDAEVMLDAICQTTDVPEKFAGVADGYRAIQLWDSEVSHYFLRLFGRPVRETACECERNVDPSISQVLHVMNAPEVNRKISHEAGRVARLVQEVESDAKLVDELYLTFFSRYPTADEEKVAIEHMQSSPSGRRRAAEDLAWSLMNTLEFVFNH